MTMNHGVEPIERTNQGKYRMPAVQSVAVDRPVKVLLITHDLNIGGLQRVVVDIATNLDPARYTVSVCALKEGGAFEQELFNANITVHKLPSTPGKVDYVSFWKIRRLLKAMAPDIVHTHNSQPFIEGTLAGVLAGIPAMVHTDHGRYFPDKTRYMWMEWLASHFVSEIISVSEANKASLVKYEHISEKKIRVIPNGIDEKKYRVHVDRIAKRTSLGLEPDAWPVLGWCGRLSPEKGLTFLIRALRDLSRSYPRLRLLLMGEGALRKELEVQAQAEGVASYVRFLGARADVPEVLQVADVFVLPSLREGLPLVLLEAMAAGLPIVATDVGGNRQAVHEGINGLLVPSENPGALAQAIRRIVDDETLRAQCSCQARQLFEQHFTVGRMVERYDRVYRQCLTNRRIAS